jgi:hypothetical protein
LDLAAAVATGRQFRGDLATDAGAVLYLALEGGHGLRNRLAAMRKAGLLPPGTPLAVTFGPANLLNAGDAERVAETAIAAAKEAGIKPRLVIIDTLARAMAGHDENSGIDMTAAVAAVDAIRRATEAHVCLVHHCGKDEARGARGHSSLRAAVDSEIEVFRPEGSNISTVRVVKQRDLAIGEPMPFSLDRVELGTDRRGNPITSCTVRHEESFMAEERRPGRKAEHPPTVLLELLPQPSTADWQRAAVKEFDIPKSTFYRLKDAVFARKLARQNQAGGWEKS